MECEDDLLNLLLESPNSESIQTIAEQLEIDHNFSFSKDRNDLQGCLLYTSPSPRDRG